MMGDVQGRVGLRPMGNIVAIALAIVITMLVSSALLEGPSLGDLWTLYLSDPAPGLRKLAEKRWIQDIRPPVFDAWATLLAMVNLSSLTLGRLLSNIPALALLIYAVRRFARRLPEQDGFYTIFLLLTLSAPAVVDAFAIYRGDFWQLTAFAIQLLLARHIISADQDYRSRKDGMLALLGMLATIAAICLDYGGALFGGVIAMATILVSLARGFRRWARSMLIATGLAVTGVIYMIMWQATGWDASFDLYQNWIEMGHASTGGILSALLLGTILHNPIAIAGGWYGRDRWDKADTAFSVMIGAALIASLFAIVQIDSQRRMVTSSNSVDIAIMVCALLATAGAKIADRRLWMYGLAGVAALSSLVSLTNIGLGGAWHTGAKQIARIIAACPTTRVYAASGWRLDEGTRSRAAAREEPVFTMGYQRLAATRGFNPAILHPNAPQTAVLGSCPVLLWIEEVPQNRRPKPAQILKATGLQGLDKARLSVIRTATGLILRADR